MSRAEDVWIYRASTGCQGWYEDGQFNAWQPGQRALVSDAFELEPIPPCEWDQISGPERQAFESLSRMAESVGGKVECSIVHEESLLALVSPDHPLQEVETRRDGIR